ncbi:methionine ABC transporter ATP-binding protein [Alicyclobacillus tengchongensis]|nr:methionine ABC transporter ATP-binding protein [Alicyclobacillus tengchongensis]
MAEALLAIDDLRVQFDRGEDEVFAVNGVSFSIAEGEALGIVGESGSGKSVTLMSALGLIRENGKIMAGTAKFQGHDLLKMRPRQLEDIRGRDIGVIFQDPMTSLNPVMRIGDQIMESMLTHQYAGRREAFERTLQLLHEMGIPEPKARFRNYPHEFSGGMRQRIMIAIALACEPQLLIADEPTTALDVTVQMQILALLQEQRRKKQMSIAMITHDFGVATNFCDRIIVLYAGQIMEMADTRQFLRQPAHPYTMGLKNSIIEIGQRDRQLSPIPGMAPTLTEPPKSCSFASRCPLATERCRLELPALREISPNHHVACHRAEEVLAHAI